MGGREKFEYFVFAVIKTVVSGNYRVFCKTNPTLKEIEPI
jgi:hypothetical protein